MSEDLITNEKLYEALRREKSKSELQDLEANFYNTVKSYIKEKKSIIESQKDKQSIFSKTEIENTKKQLETSKKILNELFEKREQKIVQLALLCSRTNPEDKGIDTLIENEKEFYFEILEILNKNRDFNLNSLINQEKELKTKDINTTQIKQQNKLLRIISPIPKFIGLDLKTYGPFDNEEVANLPLKIAEVLINNNRAEEIKNEPS
ncbi:hypothetical protein J4455_04455 [Candidatus Woesearchaeota archaeon]|nr:hypothetical protein [Candidatus Woesearchaeota archaeon]